MVYNAKFIKGYALKLEGKQKQKQIRKYVKFEILYFIRYPPREPIVVNFCVEAFEIDRQNEVHFMNNSRHCSSKWIYLGKLFVQLSGTIKIKYFYTFLTTDAIIKSIFMADHFHNRDNEHILRPCMPLVLDGANLVNKWH